MLKKLEFFFRQRAVNPNIDHVFALECIDKITEIIKANIIRAIKVWGSCLLREPDTEFEL